MNPEFPGPATGPLLRKGLFRKARSYTRNILSYVTGQRTGTDLLAEIVTNFTGQMLADLHWAWTEFGDDELAREITWRYAVAADQIGDVIRRPGFSVVLSNPVLIEICERGIEAVHLLSDETVRMRLEGSLAGRAGHLNLEIGRIDRAGKLLSFALARAEATSDIPLKARLCNFMGDLQILYGNYAEALRSFTWALDSAARTGDALVAAVACLGRGKSHRLLGEPVNGLADVNAALTYFRAEHRVDMEAAVLLELGAICMGIGDLQPAAVCFEESLALLEREGNIVLRPRARVALAEALLWLNRRPEARGHLERAEADYRLLGDDESRDRVRRRLLELPKACGLSGTHT